MESPSIDFAHLPFGYMKTDANIRYWFRDGAWSAGELTADETVPLHMAATCLHYGQEIFEGLKIFGRPDGRIQAFRSASKILMETVPVELFRDAVHRVVKANRRFVPPYGSGASLYVRPFEIGISAEVGVKPSQDYLFMIFVTPVGPYYKSGFKPVKLRVEEEIHRAAPGGVGDIKCGGNYAAGMRASIAAKHDGFADVLYLDARENRWIDESGASNFFAIKGRTFMTPKSESILESITRLSVIQIAKDLGYAIEHRPIDIAELPSFEEAGCLGTAAAITPVESISIGAKAHSYAKDGVAGPKVTEIYKRLCAIQYGETADPYGWTEIIG